MTRNKIKDRNAMARANMAERIENAKFPHVMPVPASLERDDMPVGLTTAFGRIAVVSTGGPRSEAEMTIRKDVVAWLDEQAGKNGWRYANGSIRFKEESLAVAYKVRWL